MHEIRIGEDLREKNEAIADENRKLLAAKGVVSINVMSAPGAGKTSLLLRTIPLLRRKHAVGVIEGDIQTTTDAEKICHLDAAMVHSALHQLDLDSIDLLFVENVGNLVCPAEFDLGEDARVMLLSVSEGDDKPKKYPLMFRESRLLLLNKIDLAPYVAFDIAKARRESLEINPKLEIIEISCTTGAGLDRWVSWIDAFVESARRR
jgi:hydrogenase nickel incorporation protein HypB